MQGEEKRLTICINIIYIYKYIYINVIYVYIFIYNEATKNLDALLQPQQPDSEAAFGLYVCIYFNNFNSLMAAEVCEAQRICYWGPDG